MIFCKPVKPPEKNSGPTVIRIDRDSGRMVSLPGDDTMSSKSHKKIQKQSPPAKKAFFVSLENILFGGLIIGLGLLSWSRERMYTNESTLWHATISKNPKAWIAYNELGNYYADRGNFEDAIKWYLKCLEIKPDHAKAANNLANIYASQGRYDDAVKEYQRSIALNPGYFDPYFNLGEMYFTQRRINDAIQAYQAAAKINPDDFDVHHSLGVVYMYQGSVDDALREFLMASRIKSGAEIHKTIAGLYVQKKFWDEALLEYEKALKIDPADSTSYVNKGMIFYNLGKYLQAIEEWEKASTREPDNKKIKDYLRDAKDKIKA
jgi:tetratricopeptide (TPR) repeat protein